MNKSALVLGSTGLIGSLLVQELLEDSVYKHIILVNRRPSGIIHEKVQEIITDFEQFDFMNDVIPVDTVFSCLGTTKSKTPDLEQYKRIEIIIPKNIIQRCMIKGSLNAVHVVSAVGANAQSANFYTQLKGELEAAISNLEVPRTFLYRPSFLKGKRTNDNRLGERIALFLMPLLDAFFKGKWAKYHSIDAEKVAAAMVYNDVNNFVNGVQILEYDAIQMSV